MDVLSTVVSLSGLVFVVASMLAMGLSLTLPQVMAPLRDVRLVALSSPGTRLTGWLR